MVLTQSQRWDAQKDPVEAPSPRVASTAEKASCSQPKQRQRHKNQGRQKATGIFEDADTLSARLEHRFNTGWSRFRDGDFAAAAKAFEEVIEADIITPLQEDTAFWNAIALIRAQNKGAARRALRRYLSRYPDTRRAPDVITRLGWLLFEAGQVNDARTHFQAGSRASDPKVRQRATLGLEAVEAAEP